MPDAQTLALMMSAYGSDLSLRVFSFADPAGVVLTLFRCESGAPECAVATVALDSLESPAARQLFRQHQSGTALPLTHSLTAYWMDTHQDGQAIASLMWQQDGVFYTVRIPAEQRNHLMGMAQSMAIARPLPSAQIAAAPDTQRPQTPVHSPPNSPGTAAPHPASFSFLDSIQQNIPPDWAVRLPPIF